MEPIYEETSMSLLTAAVCYRAGGEPPLVTAADLAGFAERVLALGLVSGETLDVELKFGRAIDQDTRSTTELVELGPSLALDIEYDWHVSSYGIPPAEALALLRNPPTSREIERKRRHPLDFFHAGKKTEHFDPYIYRARLGFGMLKEDYYQTICCDDGEEDPLWLVDLNFYIDVVELTDPEGAGAFNAGWMSFAVSGHGSLSPHTYDQTLASLRTHPELSSLREICRELWPASPTPPSPAAIASRRRMGLLWSEPPEAPYDWYWAINVMY